MFAYLYGQTGRRQDASDLLQETFLRVWKYLSRVHDADEESRRSWIMRLARTSAIDFRRREAVRSAVNAPLPERMESGTPSHESRVVDALAIQAVDSAVKALPATHRTVLTMTVLGGLSSEEIGRLLGRPPATVRYQLAEARKRVAREAGL